jgi:Fe2+ transport system protein FeoA
MTLSLHQLPQVDSRQRAGTIKLSQLKTGETGRIVRVGGSDAGCRKRFAEMGLAEGMKVTMSGAGESVMLLVGNTKLALACRCAEDILVIRV